MTKHQPTPLSVLDLSPIATGHNSAEALRNSIDLAVSAEVSGYSRFWLAEHHLSPGVAGTSPHVLSALIAAATHTIKVGSAATVMGNYRPVQIAENVGVLAALYPGRVDLGLGRSGLSKADELLKPGEAEQQSAPAATRNTVVDGLVIPPAPPRPSNSVLERFALQSHLLGRTAHDAESFGGDSFKEDVQDIIAFFAGNFRSRDGVEITVSSAKGNAPQLWIHGSSAGPSARLAGKLGLPFGANYHVAPSAVLDSIAEYRTYFTPSPTLSEPYIAVTADVLVAPTETHACTIGAGYAEWVHGIRTGQGAVPYPSPENAKSIQSFTPEQRALVQDRLDTRFVGNPAQVSESLRTLQRATGANELVVTTVAHHHADRVLSQELLANSWLSS